MTLYVSILWDFSKRLVNFLKGLSRNKMVQLETVLGCINGFSRWGRGSSLARSHSLHCYSFDDKAKTQNLWAFCMWTVEFLNALSPALMTQFR